MSMIRQLVKIAYAYKRCDIIDRMSKSLTLQELIDLIMQQAKTKGFGTTPEEVDVPEKIALIHSEVTEAYTAYRHKNIDGKDGLTEELGDVIQRVLHLCGALNLDVEQAILQKLEHNKDREWRWSELNESSHKQ
jgi:NTP pyrophosphatase (non-canonical NTP hydrolase)